MAAPAWVRLLELVSRWECRHAPSISQAGGTLESFSALTNIHRGICRCPCWHLLSEVMKNFTEQGQVNKECQLASFPICHQNQLESLYSLTSVAYCPTFGKTRARQRRKDMSIVRSKHMLHVWRLCFWTKLLIIGISMIISLEFQDCIMAPKYVFELWGHGIINQFNGQWILCLLLIWNLSEHSFSFERLKKNECILIVDIHVIVVAMLMIFWCDQCGVREFTGKSVGEHVRIVRRQPLSASTGLLDFC